MGMGMNVSQPILVRLAGARRGGGLGSPGDLGCGQMGSALMGQSAKVRSFDGRGETVRPGTFGKRNVG